jgi:hypothetical protein
VLIQLELHLLANMQWQVHHHKYPRHHAFWLHVHIMAILIIHISMRYIPITP